MNFKLHLSISFLLFIHILMAQNPISPPGVYFADPSAQIWKDGNLYLYGSLDESLDYYCSTSHYVMKTADMQKWEIFKDVFSSKGQGDAVPYNDELLFAPDCAYKEGNYYMYYCQPTEVTEGVAVSKSPTGPFTNGKPLITGGYNEIDPAVFIDDDDQVYYLWGQFTLKMAKMKPNMTELDLKTIRDNVITEKKHHFHEGAYLSKRNGIYYMVYADISRADMPTCIGYATSKSVFGPYTYGGVIVDNNHCDPGNWNNHGSIIEFKDQWYVFYHRSTHASNVMRKACVEPITFNANGTINEVEMTSQGAGPPLDAAKKIEAERACLLFGNVRIEAFDTENEKLTKIHNKDKVVYKYIDFKEGVKTISIRIKKGKNTGEIYIMIDKPWHKRIAKVNIEPANSNEWETLTFKVDNTKGVHALWLQFFGNDKDLYEIDWIKFNR